MELIIIFIIILLTTYISAVLILKKSKINELIISIILAVYLFLMTIINIPTFMSPLEKYKFKIIELIFVLYNKSTFLYILISNILVNLFIPLLYKLLVNKISSKKNVCKEFNNFCEDANELIVLGKDLDFLQSKKNVIQKEKIKKLNSKCRIICQEISRPSKFKINQNTDEDIKYKESIHLYNELYKSGVNIKCFPNTIDQKYSNFKKMLGQIKITATTKSMKIVSKVGKKFENIDVNGIDLVELLEKML